MIPRARRIGFVGKRNGGWLVHIEDPDDVLTPYDQFTAAATLTRGKEIVEREAKDLLGTTVHMWARDENGDHVAYEHERMRR